MSILGAYLRVRSAHAADIAARLAAMPGVDIGANPGDGRLVLVLEDVHVNGELRGAAHTLAAIATWPEVLHAGLVFEHTEPDESGASAVHDYRAWRGGLADTPAPRTPATT